MCNVSDKLKLCTCDAGKVIEGNYWTLFRFVGDKRIVTIGEPVVLATIDATKDNNNKNLLLQLLNDGNVFDEPLYAVEKDKLLISFDLGEKGRLNYGFLYKNKKWNNTDYDFFDWDNENDEIKEGIVTT